MLRDAGVVPVFMPGPEVFATRDPRVGAGTCRYERYGVAGTWKSTKVLHRTATAREAFMYLQCCRPTRKYQPSHNKERAMSPTRPSWGKQTTRLQVTKVRPEASPRVLYTSQKEERVPIEAKPYLR